MSKICQITGKKPVSGQNVSHSNRKTKRTFKPNVHKKYVFNPETGTSIWLSISMKALRTLKKMQKEGKKFDLRKMLIK
jgi:large subunit ribosomal protein L28